jgi:hypothetical protein
MLTVPCGHIMHATWVGARAYMPDPMDVWGAIWRAYLKLTPFATLVEDIL